MKRIVFFALLVMGWATLAWAGEGTLPKPDVLGNEEVFLTERLSSGYDGIIVRDFSTAGAEVVNMDKDEQVRLNQVKADIVRILSESIVKTLKSETRFARVSTKGNAGPRTLVLEGKFTRFNAGHGAAKVFLGWMAPESAKTNISVSGRLIDARSGKELATFSDTRSGHEGTAIGFVGEVFKIQAKDQGEEIAKFIGKLY